MCEPRVLCVNEVEKEAGCMNTFRPWTEEEDEILRTHFPEMGAKVASLLPGRTRGACQKRASNMNLTDRKVWTEAEEEILRANYPTMGRRVAELLPNHSDNACQMRAQILGVKKADYHRARKWTAREDDIIRENYPIMGTSVQDYLPGRTKDACQQRANFLGVVQQEYADRQMNPKNKWSREEDAVLREYYPQLGRKVVQYLPNRSETSCYTRAYKLGLKVHNWTRREDSILRKHYPVMGGKVSALLPNHTKAACIARATRLNVKIRYRWNETEDEIIRNNYPTMGGAVARLIPSHSRGACITRAGMLGVRYVGVENDN